MEMKKFRYEDNLSIAVKMKSLPYCTSVTTYTPDVIQPLEGLKWGSVIHKLFTGVLI